MLITIENVPKYLHKNWFYKETECPWNEDVCATAIQNDEKECFLYAYQNGCPWNLNNQSFEVQQKVANWLSN